MSDLILVRHPEVDHTWKRRCYGATDVPLSDEGRADIPRIAEEITQHGPCRVIHSDLKRARELAIAIADKLGCDCVADERFQEMNFGEWEGQDWDAIFATVGHDMARLIHEPATYAPLGGETVYAVRHRVIAALADLPLPGRSVVITHGGPISTVLGSIQESPATTWPGLVPVYGSTTILTASDRSKLLSFLKRAGQAT